MMRETKCRAALGASVASVIFALATPAFSQAPTDAQRSAIRSECRSDYEAHCASVPPGGEASLQCLQKNMSRPLALGCQSAVRAIEPADRTQGRNCSGHRARANSKADTATAKPTEPAAAAEPKAAASTAKKPSDAQVAAIRSSSAPTIKKSVPAYRPEAPRRCNAWKRTSRKSGAGLSEGRQRRQRRRNHACGRRCTGGHGDRRARPRLPAAAAPATVLVLRPMRPREELFVLRSACGGDVRALCGGVQPGGGQMMCNVWPPRPPLFRPPARTSWPNSPRNKYCTPDLPAARENLPPGRPLALPRGSTGSTGSTKRSSRTS